MLRLEGLVSNFVMMNLMVIKISWFDFSVDFVVIVCGDIIFEMIYC